MKILCPSILIVDDSAFARKLLSDIVKESDELKELDYSIIGEASNGKMAINKYEELKPDFVLLDIIMDTMDGIDTLEEIKKIDQDAKVIMASGIKYTAMIKRAVQKGAIDFITKPIQKDEVVKVLKRVYDL